MNTNWIGLYTFHEQKLNNWINFGSTQSKYSTPWGVFRKKRTVGISWHWFSRPYWPKKETEAKLGCPLYNSFLISSLKICFLWTNYMYVSNVAYLPEVYYKCFNTKFASENGLLSSSKGSKCSMAALR